MTVSSSLVSLCIVCTFVAFAVVMYRQKTRGFLGYYVILHDDDNDDTVLVKEIHTRV